MHDSFFKNGSAWVRADFHLHTKADKEFSNKDKEDNSFSKDFVEKLTAQDVRVGVITNHNKFDLGEFKSLRKQARKADILLLPGVELSVKDGANGVHCLIVFDYDGWIKNDENFIEEHFLRAAFEGISNRWHENTSCKYNLEETLGKLDVYKKEGRDSFIIMAHVNDNKGFLDAFQGNRITELAKLELFRTFVLGFQKFRNYEGLHGLNLWFEDKLPAFVEGSDCKNLNQVGQAHTQKGEEKKTWLKLGDFTFEAVKYALIHHDERVQAEIHIPKALHLRAVHLYRDGSDEPTEIPLNACLNTIVGVRGGGKSSLLETIRYGLGLSPKEDEKYKTEVITKLLGNGGWVELEFWNEHGQHVCSIQRYSGNANVRYLDTHKSEMFDIPTELQMDAAYFGQKDLAKLGENKASNFNEKIFEDTLLANELKPFKAKIKAAIEKVESQIRQLEKVKKQAEKEQQVESEIKKLLLFIQIFDEKGIETLLQKESNCRHDETRLGIMSQKLAEFARASFDNMTAFNAQALLDYESSEPENEAFFVEKVRPQIQHFADLRELVTAKLATDGSESLLLAFQNIQAEFSKKLATMDAEFAEAKRGISSEVNVEDYHRAKQRLQIEQDNLAEIQKSKHQAVQFEKQLSASLAELQAVWQEEFEFIKSEVEKLNSANTAIQISLNFQLDKVRFQKSLGDLAKGSGLRDLHIERLCEAYENTIAIYRDFKKEDSQLHRILSSGSLLPNFISKTQENLAGFLTSRTPDQYAFLYNNRPLGDYSIGQKATALIAFILSNDHKNLFLIDQPEDDLDNFTVAEEIINRIKKLKTNAQFIFVTHNPNILVLGDSEQVVVCEFDGKNEKIGFPAIGSIDRPCIQQTAVRIMEGGKEAFERRKNIYQLWRP